MDSLTVRTSIRAAPGKEGGRNGKIWGSMGKQGMAGQRSWDNCYFAMMDKERALDNNPGFTADGTLIIYVSHRHRHRHTHTDRHTHLSLIHI